METAETLAKDFFGLWKEILSSFFSVLPLVISFIFWVICAFIILPCVFVAGTLYPKWVEWGEKF